MGTQRARFEAWFEQLRDRRTPSEKAELLKAADAFDTSIACGELPLQRLQIIVDAASSPQAFLWMNATGLLAHLSTRWDSAAEAIRTMFRHRQAHVRFAALCSLSAQSLAGLVDSLLAVMA